MGVLLPTGETGEGAAVTVWTQVVGTHEVWVTTVTEGLLLAGGAGAGAELMTGAGAVLEETGATPAGVVVAAAGVVEDCIWEAGQLVTVGAHEVMVTSSVE